MARPRTRKQKNSDESRTTTSTSSMTDSTQKSADSASSRLTHSKDGSKVLPIKRGSSHHHHHDHHQHSSPSSASSTPSLSSSPDVSALTAQQEGLSLSPFLSDDEEDIQFVAGENVDFEYAKPANSNSQSVATPQNPASKRQHQQQQPSRPSSPSMNNNKPAYIQNFLLQQKAAVDEMLRNKQTPSAPALPLPAPPISSFFTEKLTFQEFLQSKEVAKIHDTAKKFAQLRLQQLQNEHSTLTDEQRAQVECFLEHQRLLPTSPVTASSPSSSSPSTALTADQQQLANEQYAANVNAISSLATVAAAAALHQFKTKDVFDLLNDSTDNAPAANGGRNCASTPNGTSLQRETYSNELRDAINSYAISMSINPELNVGSPAAPGASPTYSNSTSVNGIQQPQQQQLPPPLQQSPQLPQSVSSAAVSRKFESDKIWDTSTTEEKERVRQFWRSLSYEERRELVKIPKQTVMQEMREQKRNKDCNCHLCGKKRLAIEELESLYDAYSEIERYSGLRSRIEEVDEDGSVEGDPNSNSNGNSDSVYDDRGPDKDFFSFGNTLSIQGGILTVADDLLKNDGKKFIDMMAHLKEQQQRTERDDLDAMAEYEVNPPQDDEDNVLEYTDDDGKYDDDIDEYEEDGGSEEYEDGTDTEEARWAESKQLLQEFAIKIFEQRLMNAYREKVARERQEKLLEELEEEERLNEEREAKRVRDKEKKKERKKQQRQAKEEERLKKQAEQDREQAAIKERQRQKADEVRRKKLDQKLKKEAERRRQDEERQRRLEEERKREQQKKEQEEREQREKEETLRKEKEDRESKEKAEREAKEKAERERFEREKQELEEKVRQERLRHEELERELREQEERTNRIKLEHQHQLLQSLKQHAEESGAPTAVTVAANLSPQAATSSHFSPVAPVDLGSGNLASAVPSPGTYGPNVLYQQYPQQIPLQDGFFVQQQQPQQQPDLSQFGQSPTSLPSNVPWTGSVLPPAQNFSGGMFYGTTGSHALSPVIQTGNILSTPIMGNSINAQQHQSTSPPDVKAYVQGMLQQQSTARSPGINGVTLSGVAPGSAIVEGTASSLTTAIQRPHSNSSSNSRIVPNRSFTNTDNPMQQRFGESGTASTAGTVSMNGLPNTSAISDSPVSRPFIGTPQPRSRTSSLFAANTSGGFFGDSGANHTTSAVENGWSLTSSGGNAASAGQPAKPVSRRGSMWSTPVGGSSALWGSDAPTNSVSPPLSASATSAPPSSLLDRRPETSAVSSEFITQAALAAYQDHARGYANLPDGKVNAQLLYVAALNLIPGPRINLQEFFAACEKPDEAGIVHFELIRNHLGLVTHIRHRPQQASAQPQGVLTAQQPQQQPQQQSQQQVPAMAQMYNPMMGLQGNQQGTYIDQHLQLQQQHYLGLTGGVNLPGSLLGTGSGGHIPTTGSLVGGPFGGAVNIGGSNNAVAAAAAAAAAGRTGGLKSGTY